MARLVSRRVLIVVAAGYVASLAAYPKLPYGPGIPQPLIAFLLPTTAILIHALVRRIWERDLVRDSDDMFEPDFDAIVFAVVLFVIAIHLLVLAALTGALPAQSISLVRTTIVLFGLLMARIGNLLPRTRPNLALGIRTPRTLSNRRLWMQTHRMAGYVGVGLGLVFVVSGAFLPKATIELVIGSAVPAAAVLLVVSHFRNSFANP